MAFGKKKQQSSTDISREELTRTQVLNLQELERVAKFERQTSKRPAVLFAFAGFLAITLGCFYPNIMMAVDDIGTKPETAYRVNMDDNYDDVTTPVATDKVICNLQLPYQPDGTDKTYTYELFFQTQQLQTYVKSVVVNATLGNPDPVGTIQNQFMAFSANDATNLDGYVSQTTNENGIVNSSITIDLKKLDKTLLTYNHVINAFTNPEYNLNDDQTAIQNDLAAKGYVCTIAEPQQ